KVDSEPLPLQSIWNEWWQTYPSRDPILLLEAYVLVLSRTQMPLVRMSTSRWEFEQRRLILGDTGQLSFTFPGLLQSVLGSLIAQHPKPEHTDFFLNIVETALALIPYEVLRNGNRNAGIHTSW